MPVSRGRRETCAHEREPRFGARHLKSPIEIGLLMCSFIGIIRSDIVCLTPFVQKVAIEGAMDARLNDRMKEMKNPDFSFAFDSWQTILITVNTTPIPT